MAESGGIRGSQVKSEDRHGSGEIIQMSDNTGASGNLAKFDATGRVTDSGVSAASVSALPNGTIKGQLLVWDGSAWQLFSPGTDGYVLTSDSLATDGLSWQADDDSGSSSGGGPSPAPFIYYRLRITGCASATNTSLAEWKLYDTSGSQITTGATGGTASASSTNGGNVAANAFDGSNSTYWDSSSAPSSGSPITLQYAFNSAATVKTFSITSRPDSFYPETPTNFTLEASNDGTTWTTLATYAAVWSSASQTQTFTLAGSVVTYYRLQITACASSTNTSLAELKFYDSTGAQITTGTSAGLASANSTNGSFVPANAFDGSDSTFWDSSGPPSTGSPITLQYAFNGTVSVDTLSITSRPDSFYPETPGTFAIQKSTDGTNWTTLAQYTTTWSGSSQTQTFAA